MDTLLHSVGTYVHQKRNKHRNLQIVQYTSQQQLTVAPMSVAQVNISSFLNVPNTVTTASGAAEDVSLVAQVLPNSDGTTPAIVAERSLYFDFQGSMVGETSVVGYS